MRRKVSLYGVFCLTIVLLTFFVINSVSGCGTQSADSSESINATIRPNPTVTYVPEYYRRHSARRSSDLVDWLNLQVQEGYVLDDYTSSGAYWSAIVVYDPTEAQRLRTERGR